MANYWQQKLQSSLQSSLQTVNSTVNTISTDGAARCDLPSSSSRVQKQQLWLTLTRHMQAAAARPKQDHRGCHAVGGSKRPCLLSLRLRM